MGLKATHGIEQAQEALGEIQKLPAGAPELAQIRAAIGRANAGFRSVLEVAESADRRPPAQALALYEEARRELDAQAEKLKAVHAR